jgi:hypothetical protein
VTTSAFFDTALADAVDVSPLPKRPPELVVSVVVVVVKDFTCLVTTCTADLGTIMDRARAAR